MISFPKDRVELDDPDVGGINPILGNFELPVEIDDAPKMSGTHNLSREGWNEDSQYLSLYTNPLLTSS
jgi:hypothetical protein